MRVRHLVVPMILVVVLAGCSLPIDGLSGPTETPSKTNDGTVETPTPSPTEDEQSAYPPGVNETEIRNESALLEAHTNALNDTGYVAEGSGDTTILRSGFLINVSRDIRIDVAAGSRQYHEVRRTEAGPVDRLVKRYSNGSVELRRHQENGDVEYRRHDPRSAEKLANADIIESFLRGGDFRMSIVRDEEDPALFVLEANESDNETELRSNLPENAQEILSYNATVLIDEVGRVRSLEASIGFVINGKNRTHVVSFDVTRIGVENVSEPDWVAEVNESDGSAAARPAGPLDHSYRRSGPDRDPTRR